VICTIYPDAIVKYSSVAHGMKFGSITQATVDVVFRKYVSTQTSIVIPAIVVNHIKPFAAMIVTVCVAFFVAAVSVLVLQSIVDELTGTKFAAALKAKSVIVPEYFTHSVFAVAAVPDY
jgi:hypothetical protein